jgi:hypothetical protein
MKPILGVFLAAALLAVPGARALAEGTQLRFAIRSDPKTLNPLLVDEESGELVRYLTSGVLMRINRVTQKAEPELATAWRWRSGDQCFEMRLRRGVRFSDGAAFTAHDVAYTFERIMDSSVKSPLADAFRSPKGDVVARVVDLYTITLTFPNHLAGIERLLDQVPILSRDSTQHEGQSWAHSSSNRMLPAAIYCSRGIRTTGNETRQVGACRTLAAYVSNSEQPRYRGATLSSGRTRHDPRSRS